MLATDRWAAAVADTLGFYTRCKCALTYNKWLDKVSVNSNCIRLILCSVEKRGVLSRAACGVVRFAAAGHGRRVRHLQRQAQLPSEDGPQADEPLLRLRPRLPGCQLVLLLQVATLEPEVRAWLFVLGRCFFCWSPSDEFFCCAARFGGVQPHFGPGWGLEQMGMKYLQTGCWGLGCCYAWERKWVDEQIDVHAEHEADTTGPGGIIMPQKPGRRLQP
jgi:hypothetical protein